MLAAVALVMVFALMFLTVLLLPRPRPGGAVGPVLVRPRDAAVPTLVRQPPPAEEPATGASGAPDVSVAPPAAQRPSAEDPVGARPVPAPAAVVVQRPVVSTGTAARTPAAGDVDGNSPSAHLRASGDDDDDDDGDDDDEGEDDPD